MIRIFYRLCGKTYNEQHTAAYDLLYAAASVCGLPAGRVQKTENGKPYFPDEKGTFFSLSHTDGYAVCAIGDSPCGIDIERDRAISDRIINKYLGGCARSEALRRWTERESLGKYVGRGFFTDLPKEKVSFVSYTIGNCLITLCTKEGTEVSSFPEQI